MNPEKDWYSQYLHDVGCESTGRVIFRGYYKEDYDEYERDYYYVNAYPFEDEEE